MLLGVMTMTEHLTDGPCHAVFFRDNLLLKSLSTIRQNQYLKNYQKPSVYDSTGGIHQVAFQTSCNLCCLPKVRRTESTEHLGEGYSDECPY